MNKHQDDSKDSFKTIAAMVGDEDTSYKEFFIFVLIQRNLELIKTYEDLAHSMKTEELKAFFSDMSQLKSDDMQHFQKVYCHDDIEALVKVKQVELSSILRGESNTPAIKGMEEACQYVLHVEFKNSQLYLQLSQLETDPSLKKLFIDAHQMHKSNLNHLEKRIKSFASTT